MLTISDSFYCSINFALLSLSFCNSFYRFCISFTSPSTSVCIFASSPLFIFMFLLLPFCFELFVEINPAKPPADPRKFHAFFDLFHIFLIQNTNKYHTVYTFPNNNFPHFYQSPHYPSINVSPETAGILPRLFAYYQKITSKKSSFRERKQ